MSSSGRLTLPNVQDWLGGYPRSPEVVGKPTQMSRSGQKTHPDVREWSEALPYVQEWSEDLPECP